MKGIRVFALLALAGALGCAEAGKINSIDAGDQVAQQDVAVHIDQTSSLDLVADETAAPDVTTPNDVAKEIEEGPLAATFSTSDQQRLDASIYMVASDANKGGVTLTVMAGQLGKVAGLAFTLNYDPASLKLLKATSLMDLGKATAIETRSIAREGLPGMLAFGVARFCTAKMPWGKADQCGGVAVDDPVPVAEFRFELLKEGTSGVFFDQSSTLIRRPDRSAVVAHWINGNVLVGRE